MLIKTTNTTDDGRPVTRSLRCPEDPGYVVEFRDDATARVREEIGEYLIDSDRYPSIEAADDRERDGDVQSVDESASGPETDPDVTPGDTPDIDTDAVSDDDADADDDQATDPTSDTDAETDSDATDSDSDSDTTDTDL